MLIQQPNGVGIMACSPHLISAQECVGDPAHAFLAQDVELQEVCLDLACAPAEAITALNATGDIHRVVEQPCETYGQHLAVRAAVGQPLAIDESLVTVDDMVRIVVDRACEVVGLKVGRVGGITPARRIRDVAAAAGIRMNVEDTGGTALSASAAVHLAQATPGPLRRATWLCFDHLTDNPVEGGVANDGGTATAPSSPGIGAVPDQAALGQPLATFEADR